MLPFNSKPMEYTPIDNTDSYLKQMITKYSFMEMTQTQPNTPFLKNVLQCYLNGETIFTPLLVLTKSSPKIVILRSSSSLTTTHIDINLSIA